MCFLNNQINADYPLRLAMHANLRRISVCFLLGLLSGGLVHQTEGMAQVKSSSPANKIKVACVGDSITFGFGIKDRDSHSYPALLQAALGAGYDVGNFGYSGATLLKKGHKPYWEKPPFQPSLEFAPNIVVINLGANDAVDLNWKHEPEFRPDYLELIRTYRELPSKPQVFICEILPIMPNHGKYEECTRNRKSMTELIRQAAQGSQVGLIDLHSPFVDHPEMFPDGLHPNEEGAAEMASNVFTAITGKPAPTIRIASATFDGPDGTSFEDCAVGSFTSLNTSVGTWEAESGHAEVDRAHAKTGDQCLHLLGGDNRQTVLKLANNIKADGQLSFWAERWTSRSPFSFRIEKWSNGKWTEIYNGDLEVRLGRAFLSHVTVPLGDPAIKSLRFTCTSPANSGILIDDLCIKAAAPQKLKSVVMEPFALPALIGNPAAALIKIKIETSGTLQPISLTELDVNFDGTTDLNDLANVRVYYTGSSSNFAPSNPIGEAKTPAAKLTFTGQQALSEGVNYFWVAGQLKPHANIDHRLGGSCQSLKFSDGSISEIHSIPSMQMLGVALRKGGDDEVHTYRIPGLATTNQGTLIGVYDIRHDSGGDLPGNIDVGMSRSTDGGQNWEPMKTIMDMGDDPKWRGDGIGDPAVLVDRQTGSVWVAAVWSHGNRGWHGSEPGLKPTETGQLILVRSDDDGVTWSPPINITEQVKKPDWSFLLQGPGKGITMSDGTLVFPAQYQDPPSKNQTTHRLPYSTLIYSRDNGTSWQTGTGAWDDTTESQIVELSDGQLMINCRTNRGSKRAVLTTTDLGKTWQEHPTNLQALIEPHACMASLINCGRELDSRQLKSNYDKNVLLFSNPDSLEGRNHMTIKASLDAGMSWPESHQLLLDEAGGAGYSCLSMIDAETVGILYEGSQSHMTFQRVKIKDILHPPQHQKTKNPATVEQASSLPSNKSQVGSAGQFSVSRVFGDHMVLQRDAPVRIWGTAPPKAIVNVQLGLNKTKTIAAADGTWLAELPSQRESNENAQTLTIQSGSDKQAFTDILVGEVWLCAGQSNMEFPLSNCSGAAATISAADNHSLRLLNFPGAAGGSSGEYNAQQFAALQPERFSAGHWAVANPKSVSDFSGVGYFFAKRLQTELNCPVGIINVSAGGTPIESWISENNLAQHPTLKKMLNGNWLDNPELDEWCRGRAKMNLQRGLAGNFEMPGNQFGPNHCFKPGFMHDAAVAPFQPMSIRGVLWYQGESNADNRQRIDQYSTAFPVLVGSWRKEFQNPDLAWGFVQLPAMGRSNWPIFREQQRRSLSKLANVGMAITIDIGHPTNVHPTDKGPVGARLAAWALATVYDQSHFVAMGPLLKGEPVNDSGRLIIDFEQVGDGLTTTDSQSVRHFEIAGTKNDFRPATARIISKNQIEVSSAAVHDPHYVRYAWVPFPKPSVNLVNSVGFPASPFTSEIEF